MPRERVDPRTTARKSVRSELERVLAESEGVDAFVHGLTTFLVELARSGRHPLVVALGEELSRAADTPITAAALHDLRSLLQGVSTSLEVAPRLLDRVPTPSAAAAGLELVREALADAREGAQLAAQLAAETLAVQRRATAPTATTTVLNPVIATACRLAQRLAPVEVRLETDAGLRVRGERSQLTRVLVNLLRNAAQALSELEEPQGASITVASWASDEFAFVQVADDGPGIAAASRAAIFDAFFTTHGEGTGLGLYLCKSLVEGWGGMIHVDSREGEGARFTFSVPRANEG